MAPSANRLFDHAFLVAQKDLELSPEPQPEQFEFCKQLFIQNKDILAYTQNELQNKIIWPILKALGWTARPLPLPPLETKGVSAVFRLAEISSLENPPLAQENLAQSQDASPILGLATPKSPLDNLRASRDNPILGFLTLARQARAPWAFLTNGLHWLLAREPLWVRAKKYLAFNLEKISRENDLDNFRLFWAFFAAENFFSQAEARPLSDQFLESERLFRQTRQAKLLSLILGSDGQFSLFEEIGRHLFVANKRLAAPEDLAAVFEQSLIFFCRLVLLAHFEGHFAAGHDKPLGPKLTLKKIIQEIDPQQKKPKAWPRLRKLFLDLAPNQNLYPWPSGGLFDPQKAPLLTQARLFSEAALARIFDRLFDPEDSSPEPSFLNSALAPQSLGGIYESLLSFEFRVAPTKLFYAASSRKEETIEGFFDQKLLAASSKPLNILRSYKKGDLYLASFHNQRKVSGSYFTPDSLAWPLARRGLKSQLAGPFKNRSLADLKILDAASGGGQLLTVALDLLTDEALERLAAGADPKLQKLLDQELAAIKKSQAQLGLKPGAVAIDELTALKRVFLSRAIYGVDRSALAVEMTKWALWREGFVYGAPEPFLENRVKWGDSLLGSDLKSLLDPNLIAPLEKKLAALALLSSPERSKNLNYKERKDLYYTQILPQINELNYYVNLNNYVDILTIKKIRPKPKCLAQLKDNYLGKKNSHGDPEAAEAIKEEVLKAQKTYGFFNWPIEWPEVFASPKSKGFHLILGNPPWEKTKFEEPLFFVQYHPNYRALANSQKKAIADSLLARPEVLAKLEREKKKAELIKDYLSFKYPLSQGAGDNNLFRYFVEKALSLLAPEGTLSYIIPLSLLTDDGSMKLRKFILKNHRLTRIDGFENKRHIFADVHTRFKFGLAQIDNVRAPNQVAEARFTLTEPRDLRETEGYFPYPLADLKIVSPVRWAYMENASPLDLPILKKLYSKFPPLNPKWLDLRNDLHATNDKKFFHETPEPDFLPLYKGEMIWHYQARFAEPKYWLSPREFDERSFNKRLFRLKNDLLERWANSRKTASKQDLGWSKILGFLGLSQESDLAESLVLDRLYPRLAIRAIASDTNERTLISALLPPNIGAQNSLWLSLPGRYDLDFKAKKIIYQPTPWPRLLFAQAILNSLTVDWIARASVAMNVNKTYIFRLPIPQPSDQELTESPVCARLIRDSAALSLYYEPSLREVLWPVLGEYLDQPLSASEDVIERIIAIELEVARLYGLDAQEMSHILSNFIVFKGKRPDLYEAIKNKLAEAL
ncbi:MAG: Eco57I restriction-modification methylase domain-containing protein [Deltaproteobacteria bacterium]|jgi:hypothetical protein|nr:Eco57I restriction-modification methylase domain-containing protein [Deltaproteobacteria bacterium]